MLLLKTIYLMFGVTQNLNRNKKFFYLKNSFLNFDFTGRDDQICLQLFKIILIN